MRVALIQTSASNRLQKNLEKATSFLKDVADQGAELVCLQECFNTWIFSQRVGDRTQSARDRKQLLRSRSKPCRN